MTKDEAVKIIEKENLHGFNFEGKNINANEVGMQKNGNKWIVYHSDEKASCNIIGEYEFENDAVEHVIECLRLNKRFEERRRKKMGK
jgi:hypothetical protein